LVQIKQFGRLIAIRRKFSWLILFVVPSRQIQLERKSLLVNLHAPPHGWAGKAQYRWGNPGVAGAGGLIRNELGN